MSSLRYQIDYSFHFICHHFQKDARYNKNSQKMNIFSLNWVIEVFIEHQTKSSKNDDQPRSRKVYVNKQFTHSLLVSVFVCVSVCVCGGVFGCLCLPFYRTLYFYLSYYSQPLCFTKLFACFSCDLKYKIASLQFHFVTKDISYFAANINTHAHTHTHIHTRAQTHTQAQTQTHSKIFAKTNISNTLWY